ncbi:UDP-N-acetylglucosamine 2-epimerase (hydrolyzing) [bacterium]|nr:UDP-N-acetylglucosamine 2-epimerase (hydrolyzing) [bacterium]|tara:strand:+ start:6027 stop:7166 length:1140 start_codon:yes stop_codon:yes gene_type:complete
MRKILFVTERRADYSRFKPIIDKIIQDPDLDYYLIVTGIHLLEKHGKTIDFIEKDGIKISSVVPMFDEDAPDTGAEMVRATGRLIEKITHELERLKPDIVLSGFDIGANFAVAVAAAHMNIPVGHVQGGEVSGSIDESIRHAMSKFAHFHFPANDDAAKRLIRMGEDSQHIFTVGCPSLDALLNAPEIPKEELEKLTGLDFSQKFIIIIQHTVTTEVEKVPEHIEATLKAIKDVGVPALLLYPNNDAGTSAIIKAIENTNIKRMRTLSIEEYGNILRHAGVLVGNSSSGIHETVSFHVPTVNIGDRQAGRLRPENVIDVENNKEDIKKAIHTAFYDKEFLEKVSTCTNPYGDGRSSEKIVRILKEIPLEKELIKKNFID